MALEIERKFLVDLGTGVLDRSSSAVRMRQAYLSDDPDLTVRVRIAGDEAWLTIKTRNSGMTRNEWEYRIPVEDACDMMGRAVGRVVEKVRHRVPSGDLVWEIDVFEGALEGLVVAEVELDSEERTIDLPWFVGREVTGNPRYYNSNLAKGDTLPEVR